jgi:hypothetical protein
LEKSRIVLFTWVIPPGLGDLRAQLNAEEILRKSYPELDIQLVTLIHKEAPLPSHSCHFVRFTGLKNEEIEAEEMPLTLLREADLILQIPTYYPRTQELLDLLREMPSSKPMPKYEFLGEYGWTGQPNFSRCMGLNPLEFGIFIKQIPKSEPTSKNRFNLAYTRTQEGLYLYLYSLLKALEVDTRDIDLAFFDMKHMIENVPLLFSAPCWGLKAVHLFYKSFFTEIPLAPEGKILRLYHKELLAHTDFLKLVSQTEDLFGCTGDGSISEAISAGCMYLIDPLHHQVPFVKDLLTLAILRSPSAAEWIELMIPNAGDLSLEERGERMGELLANPETKEGMLYLSSIIREEHSVNKFLCNLVAQSL